MKPLGPRLAACTRPASVGALLALSIALLIATAVYLIARQRDQVYATANRSVVDMSAALQFSAGAVLEQSATSLRGIEQDLLSRAGPANTGDGAAVLAALRGAMRFDPASAYLGVRTAQGTWVVGRDGIEPPDERRAAMARTLPALPGTGLHLNALAQLPGDASWYLPIDLPLGYAGGSGTPLAFALVRADQLVRASDSLRVLNESYVTLASTEGLRLLRYMQDGQLLANGPPVAPAHLRTINDTQRGLLRVISPLDGQDKLFGYSRSAALPLIAGVAVPVSALNQQWMAASLAPTIVLLVGVLSVAVFGLRLMVSVRAQHRQLQKEAYLATHDGLTGLLNRDAFMRRLGALIQRLPDERLAVIVMDLNHFKDINETLGHSAGDELLQVVASRLAGFLPAHHAEVARLGGDELALCVAGDALGEPLESLCGRLQQHIGHRIAVAGVDLEVTASVGAVLYPDDAANASELLRCADIAMYAAKDEMKPCLRYDKAMDHFTAEALALKAEFAQAMREGALSLVYQPKLRLADGALVGVEALCRWTHPTLGPIPPARFMPLAESTELIHPFTDYVLHQALAQAARWRAAGHHVPMAVNISVNNLLDPHFADKVMLQLCDSGLPSAMLELEVTESAVMRQPDVVQKRLQQIHDLGVKLSIDDFGTGYASLSYLKQLPVDTLKIDRVFIAQLDSDEADRRIVKSSIQLAHGFDMTVVAEGVETEAAAALLRQFGCEHAQGFHFAKPLTAAEIEACWLGTRRPLLVPA